MIFYYFLHDIGGSLSNVVPYRKPLERPEPKFDPPATLEDIIPQPADTEKMELLELI